MRRFAVLILAAGLSSRMEQFKPLLALGGEVVADRLISTFQTAGVDVYVVTGHRGDELKAGIRSRDVTFVDNPDYRRGMFTSVQTGVRAIRSGYETFFVMPVDTPLVEPATIRSLLAASAEHPGRILYPVFSARRGHPPLVPMSLAPEIAEWNADGNLRDVLANHSELAVEISVPDEGILLDIDTPDNYRLLAKRFERSE